MAAPFLPHLSQLQKSMYKMHEIPLRRIGKLPSSSSHVFVHHSGVIVISPFNLRLIIGILVKDIQDGKFNIKHIFNIKCHSMNGIQDDLFACFSFIYQGQSIVPGSWLLYSLNGNVKARIGRLEPFEPR
jgi:hypothetical protein